jgi:L-arabinose isomerase
MATITTKNKLRIIIIFSFMHVNLYTSSSKMNNVKSSLKNLRAGLRAAYNNETLIDATKMNKRWTRHGHD